MLSSATGTRGMAGGRAGPGSRSAVAARTMFCSTTTSLGPPMKSRCSTLSRRMRTRRRRLSTVVWSMTANRGWRPRVAPLTSRPPPNWRSSQNASASRPSTTITNKTTLRPLCPSPNKVSISPPPYLMPRLNGDPPNARLFLPHSKWFECRCHGSAGAPLLADRADNARGGTGVTAPRALHLLQDRFVVSGNRRHSKLRLHEDDLVAAGLEIIEQIHRGLGRRMLEIVHQHDALA